MKLPLLIIVTATGVGCAGGSSGSTPGSAPAPAAATVMRQAAQAEPPKPKDIDPTGSYGVSLVYGGQPLAITLELAKRSDGTLGGTIYVEQTPPLPLSSVTVSGNRVQVGLTDPSGVQVTLDFTVEGAELKGTWASASGDGSPIVGRRIP